MHKIGRVLLLGSLALLALAATACSSGGADTVGSPAGSPSASDGAAGEPGGSDPISIIDDMDPDACNFIHNINACFVDGTPPEGISPGEVMDPYLAAREMLAEALGVDASTAKIADVERVDWPDTALGLPEPGMFYAQVITPGFIMVLETEGRRYTFHTSMEWVVPAQPLK